MFTGTVQEVGLVRSISSGRLIIDASKVLDNLNPGDSIAVNGACLTVTEFNEKSFTVDIMPETLKRTTLKTLNTNEQVNLERALTLEGLLNGHLVQGHVDATGKIIAIKNYDGATVIKIKAPPEVMCYVVEKGSIAVDGISLTVLARGEDNFDVSIVNFSMKHTAIGNRVEGDMVNLEADVLAKYMLQFSKNGNNSNITYDFLQQNGFLGAG
ncbi:MAG: riboflavin synthase [Dehalococcoidales bacterium]|nr:riboflavin synthase [Dehalococcoidales bacterium]